MGYQCVREGAGAHVTKRRSMNHGWHYNWILNINSVVARQCSKRHTFFYFLSLVDFSYCSEMWWTMLSISQI